MTDTIEKTRAEMLGRLQAFATELFAHKPALRSLLFSVAQYWSDNADDEVHGWMIASERDTPVWPHECVEVQGADGGYQGMRAVLAGESCANCIDDYDLYYLPFSGGYGDEVVVAFEALCREGAHQEMDQGEAYAPFAIARRGAAGAVLELVGRPLRASAVIGGAPGTSWIDARARALLEAIGDDPDDDAPRVVLADHLQQAHEPLGEALALAHARQGADRLAALIAEHRQRWLHPLGEVIAAGGAHLDRGLLRAADVYADVRTVDSVRGAPAWATVQAIRILPGSVDVVDRAMTGLRRIGPLGREGVFQLAAARQPWAIEELDVQLPDDGAYDLRLLADLSTVPRLQTLVLGVPGAVTAAELAPLQGAPWWPALRQLTVLVPAPLEALALLAAFPDKAVALAQRGEDQQPAGWQVLRTAPRAVTVSLAGWRHEANLGALVALVRALPRDHAITLAPSRFRSWTADDLAQLPTSERTIRLA